MSGQNDPQREQVSILGPTLRFKGELQADEDLLIHGQVEGLIMHSQRLTICRDGRVKANILGHVVAVEGTVDGDVHASTSVAIMESGRLKGDVQAPSVSIVDGANVNGSVTMDGSGKRPNARRQPDRHSANPAEPARSIGANGR
jgi:cytoskeletal protein CcmA (bactofilin family)